MIRLMIPVCFAFSLPAVVVPDTIKSAPRRCCPISTMTASNEVVKRQAGSLFMSCQEGLLSESIPTNLCRGVHEYSTCVTTGSKL
jgi:hypothetical protein